MCRNVPKELSQNGGGRVTGLTRYPSPCHKEASPLPIKRPLFPFRNVPVKNRTEPVNSGLDQRMQEAGEPDSESCCKWLRILWYYTDQTRPQEPDRRQDVAVSYVGSRMLECSCPGCMGEQMT